MLDDFIRMTYNWMLDLDDVFIRCDDIIPALPEFIFLFIIFITFILGFDWI